MNILIDKKSWFNLIPQDIKGEILLFIISNSSKHIISIQDI